jgi:hypothetical protein
MENSDRRYTDQEVALVLQRAAELEEQRSSGPGSARGLSRRELHDIAREVGLSPAAIDEALTTLGTRRGPGGRSLLGPALSTKMVRAVPHRLGDDALRRLIHVIEDRVDATGTVTDALGTVRWTSIPSGHKFDRTTQVSLSSNTSETQIQVVQRYPGALRAVLHFLPGAWGAMIGGAVVASSGASALAALGMGLGAAAIGMGIGRGIWELVARRSEGHVERIVAAVAEEAGTMEEQP